MKGLPERVFYSLNDIEKLWHADPSDLKQWLMHGQLKAHVWLPMISLYEIKEETDGARIILTKELRHWEGYTPLYPHHCRKIFRSGTVYLREFLCAQQNSKLALPATSESLRFTLSDLVILNEERKCFEEQHHIKETCVCNVKIIGRVGKTQPVFKITDYDPTFRKIDFNGQKHSFGDMQADVIRQLYEGATNGVPWQNGKQLLAKAGSQSFTLSNIFKRNPLWRHLIISDGRGMYRLNDSFLESVGHHQPVTT